MGGPAGKLARSHSNIFEVPQIRVLVENIFTNGITPYPTDYISTVAPAYTGATPRLHFILHSPLTLEFYDIPGNHVGYSKATGLIDYNIPGVEYERIGEVQWLSVPKDLAGRVVMNGIENGSFTLDIQEAHGNDIVSKTSFEGILSLASTVATMEILPTQEPTATGILNLDYDGEGGTPDVSLSAKENGTVSNPDLIPPEAKISVDPTTKDLLIEGTDESPTTISKNGNVYTITDTSGNTTKLFFQKTFLGKLLTFAKLTGIQYDSATKITLPSSSFLYLWNPLVNPPVLLSQTIAVNGTYAIEAVYDKKKNKTTVFLKKKGVQIQKQIFIGLRIPKLVMNNGTVGYEI
jgi:hypothetical protein